MGNRKRIISVFTYTIVHFIVDFACFFYLYGTFSLYNYTGIGMEKGMMLYLFLALGLKLLIGPLWNERNPRTAGMVGLLLLMAGVGIDLLLPVLCKDSLVMEQQRIVGISYSYWLAGILVILAIGNAFYHVAGEIGSLLGGEGRVKHCGTFLGTGALGAVMGAYMAKRGAIEEITVLCILFVAFAFVFSYGEISGKVQEKNVKIHSRKVAAGISILVFAGVAYVGKIAEASFHQESLSVACIWFGILMGGVLAEEFGGRRSGIVTLLLAAGCFSGMVEGDLARTAGMVALNMAVPVIYNVLYESLDYRAGSTAGLSGIGVLVGICLAEWMPVLTMQRGIVIFIVLASAVLVAVTVPERETKESEVIPIRQQE